MKNFHQRRKLFPLDGQRSICVKKKTMCKNEEISPGFPVTMIARMLASMEA
jgi:hypothetical protein